MSPQDRFRRTSALFRAACALPVDARNAYLSEQCADDAILLAQVRELLAADERPDGPLDHPALLPLAPLGLDGAAAAEADTPERIGTYRIIRRIGEGGMGAVFEAEQQTPRRRVAVKPLRAGISSRAVARRFEQEAEILGRLRHPGIAQILEAGTSGAGAHAVPYLVMELVQGESLLDYARLGALGRRARLELFGLVCDAVHHAHACGVVHRDLKPANILIAAARQDAGASADSVRPSQVPALQASHAPAQPKILDFGVARLTDSDLAVVTRHTTVGELVGTVPYMSPEQAAGDPSRLDWRSDVYALGVILYELLTGRLPHDVRQMMVHEAVRAIREDDPTPAGSLDHTLRGDLETILAKALEKDKARRYQSAAELAADVRRHLNEQPIVARQSSALYRLGKFARRNKPVVGGVLVAFIALALSAAVAVRQAVVAERARAREQRLRLESEHQSYRASLAAASSALRRREIAEARRHMGAAPESLRGWEWAHLHSRLDDSLLFRSTEFVPVCMVISPDGRALAACASSGHIRMWSAADWTVLAEHELKGTVAQRRVEQLCFSADGRELRADTRDGSVRLSAATLEPVSHEERVAWRRSPDGRLAVQIDDGEDRSLVVEHYATGEELFRVPGPGGRESVVCFSPEARLLAVATSRGPGLLVYRCPDGALLLGRHDLASITDLSFDHTGDRLAVALATGEAVIIETSTGKTAVVLKGHETAVVAIGFSPDGRLVATASGSGAVRTWDAASGTPIAEMLGNGASVGVLRFSPGGATLVTTAGADVRWWDATALADPFVLKAPEAVYGLAFSPDGSVLAAACLGGEGPLRTWDPATGRAQLAALDGFLSCVAFDGAGGRLAVGRSGRDAPISVLSLDGDPLASLSGHFWRTTWVAFSAGGDEILSLGNSGRLASRLIESDARTRQVAFRGDLDGEGCRASLSPDGTLLAVGAVRDLHLLDAESWKLVATLAGHTDAIYALAFSPDGTRLVSGSRDRTLRVWDARARTPIAVLHGHTDEVFAVAYSPDARRIVSAGRDRAIRVWDAERLEEITQLHGHASYVYCLAFSPDGRTLASGSGDNTVRLWSTRPYGGRWSQ